MAEDDFTRDVINAAKADIVDYLDRLTYQVNRRHLTIGLCTRHSYPEKGLNGIDVCEQALDELVADGRVNCREDTIKIECDDGSIQECEKKTYDTIKSRWDKLSRYFKKQREIWPRVIVDKGGFEV